MNPGVYNTEAHKKKFKKMWRERESKFPLMSMGVLNTGSAHAKPSDWPPIDNEWKCFGSRVCKLKKYIIILLNA